MSGPDLTPDHPHAVPDEGAMYRVECEVLSDFTTDDRADAHRVADGLNRHHNSVLDGCFPHKVKTASGLEI